MTVRELTIHLKHLVLIVVHGLLHKEQPRKYFQDEIAREARHLLRGGGPEIHVQGEDGGEDGKGHCGAGEQQVVAQEW